jgi:hypothetical protein
MKGIRRPGSIRARFTVFLGSALVLGTMQAMGAQATLAATTPPTTCSNWGDVWYSIDPVSKPYYVTHEATISVAPGATYSQTTTLGRVASITSDVTESLRGVVEENTILEKVSISAGLTLVDSGTSTVSTSVSYSWTLKNTGSTQKRYVLFTAPHKVSGTYSWWQCSRSETWLKVSGSYLSFDFELRGSALCGYAYPNGSAEHLAQVYC